MHLRGRMIKISGRMGGGRGEGLLSPGASGGTSLKIQGPRGPSLTHRFTFYSLAVPRGDFKESQYGSWEGPRSPSGVKPSTQHPYQAPAIGALLARLEGWGAQPLPASRTWSGRVPWSWWSPQELGCSQGLPGLGGAVQHPCPGAPPP